MAWRCNTPGCPYRRAFHKERLRTSCCHKCKDSNGQRHARYCVAYTSSSHHRARSRSRDVVGGVVLGAVVPPVLHPIDVRERSRHHCFVITLGLHGHFGKQLLNHNLDFLSNAIDTRSLRDPEADQRGGPWGTCIETQQRLCRHPHCEPLVRQVIGRILSESKVVVFCEHGHHRSVGVAEMAVQEINLFRVVRIDITTIHIDANQCTSQQWADLWNCRI